MIRRALIPVALAAGALLAPAAGRATPLDIPAAAPPQFRAALRAKLHTNERRPAATTRIDLPSRHGYRLMVIGEGNVVALVVIRGGGLKRLLTGRSKAASEVVTAYVTRGTVTPAKIEGSFGHLGSVSMRFRPSGRKSIKHPHGCGRRRHYTTRYGTFAGHVRFTGEHKYVAVRTHRAKGKVRTPRHVRCPNQHIIWLNRGAHAPKSRVEADRSTEATLFAEYHRPSHSTGLFAFQADETSLLLALAEESKGRMALLHYALTFVEASVITHDDVLTSATLRPPRPFHGKGIYTATPDGIRTWGGSLSIAFPGAPRLPLTGPGFVPLLEVGF